MSDRLILGWQEWIALPDLGLPALKAKVDTGARTSALHAHNIVPFGPKGARRVRFGVWPLPDATEIEKICEAALIGAREVTSSNGEREIRCLISTRLQIGTESWPIEITLTNRESMSTRMLIGRRALRPNTLVDPAAAFLQPSLTFDVYGR